LSPTPELLMSRDALVVGINTYERLKPLTSPSEDAEAIAQLLSEHSDFTVKRLPAVKKDGSTRVGQKTKVSLTQLEKALVELFMPEGNQIPDTALFFFSGHGLRKNLGIQEGYLASSDVHPDGGNWGLSLQWLRRLLQESPVRQQLVWLDCCYSGELLNFQENLKDADPGNLGKGRDRCFIAASREFEVAYEGFSSHHSLLTEALLQGLDPKRHPDRWVTNYTLVDFLNQALKGVPQSPVSTNSGGPINLIRSWQAPSEKSTNLVLTNVCPYKALEYFDCNDEDPKYFYGRTELTDQLIEKVRQGSFLAVLGASGSGKSSVVRAGLLHQLKLGRRLSGSDLWQIHILRPGEHPLQSLALAFVEPGLSDVDRATQFAKAKDLIATGAVGLECLIAASTATRVVLVVDQFEEVFTLCRDSIEQQQFFECLLGALERTGNKLCLVLVMRADFFGKCTEHEYAGLATQIEQHLVTVKPMKREELEQAIAEPAKQVGLEVERELITQMIADVDGSPGSLPLLQYTLTELWKERTNRLTVSTYARLGGVKGTLQKRANEVYESLLPQEQQVAKRIFLELTQLGEGTEDTRRQVFKRDLVSSQQSEALVEPVLQKLADAKLVVTSELQEKGGSAGRVAVVDIAHEALIRHWPLLRQWVNENRDALRKKRTIEEAAQEWLDKGKPGELAYLLSGSKLVDAEEFLQNHAESVSLSSLAQEFIEVSKRERDRILKEEEARKQRELQNIRQLLEEEEKARQAESKALEQERKASQAARMQARFAFMTAGFALVALVTAGVALWQQKQSQKTIEAVFLGTNTTELLNALPKLHKEADRFRNKVDRFKKTDDLKQAIAYYRQHERDINRSFAYYRNILSVSGRLQTKITEPVMKDKLKSISKDAEKSLAEMLYKYRISQLKLDLAKPNPQFGKFLPNKERTDFESQYQEGALQTTYVILMRESGAGADLNNDGSIADQQEAAQMPCSTLKEIEKLWRQATNERCGWYGEEGQFQDADCRELDPDRSTLYVSIFDFATNHAIERIKGCGLSIQ
jgi:energy-coupling factor transporter ATP-binding protein EcfA2